MHGWRTRSSIFMLSISNMSCSRPFSRSWLPPSFSAERALPSASSSSAHQPRHKQVEQHTQPCHGPGRLVISQVSQGTSALSQAGLSKDQVQH